MYSCSNSVFFFKISFPFCFDFFFKVCFCSSYKHSSKMYSCSNSKSSVKELSSSQSESASFCKVLSSSNSKASVSSKQINAFLVRLFVCFDLTAKEFSFFCFKISFPFCIDFFFKVCFCSSYKHSSQV